MDCFAARQLLIVVLLDLAQRPSVAGFLRRIVKQSHFDLLGFNVSRKFSLKDNLYIPIEPFALQRSLDLTEITHAILNIPSLSKLRIHVGFNDLLLYSWIIHNDLLFPID